MDDRWSGKEEREARGKGERRVGDRGKQGEWSEDDRQSGKEEREDTGKG